MQSGEPTRVGMVPLITLSDDICAALRGTRCRDHEKLLSNFSAGTLMRASGSQILPSY